MRKTRGIVWFRQDLRLHDNEALHDALYHSPDIIPVYIFDTRVFGGETMFGFPKTGAVRAQFIIDAVKDLRDSLRKLGSDLIVRTGLPEEEIFSIASLAKTSWVFCNRERTQEEIDVQDKLEKQLWTVGQEMRFSRGKMLYYTSDLPFPVNHTPDHFTTFRKETERLVPVRSTLPVPETLNPVMEGLAPGEIPDLARLTGKECSVERHFPGGESEAMRRVAKLQEMAGTADKDKFGPWGVPNTSAWLAQGCLSPKYLYEHLPAIRSGDKVLANQILGGLYYRDYLRLMGKKHGNAIFQAGGIGGVGRAAHKDESRRFKLWANGETGLPIIDAAMRQLRTTGFIPWKARVLAAQFLVKELGVHWRMGASFFESLLIDYDPCSNWVNWMNIAGVGPDSRDDRKVNYVLQAKRLDPEGTYVKYWIPALERADYQWVHQPDQAAASNLKESRIVLGEDYPRPVLSSDQWGSLN